MYEKLLHADGYNIPKRCVKCDGIMVYQGVGEYKCEDCGELAYDDYGKVRNYVEKHPGATMAQIEVAIGVSQKVTRRLLKDGRLEISSGSQTFLRCEVCGREIRSGELCPECEKKIHRSFEEQNRMDRNKKRHGTGMGDPAGGDDGQRRFMRG